MMDSRGNETTGLVFRHSEIDIRIAFDELLDMRLVQVRLICAPESDLGLCESGNTLAVARFEFRRGDVPDGAPHSCLT